MFRPSAPFVANVYITLPSPAFLEQFLRATWDADPLAWSPKNFPPNKTTLNFQIGTNF